MRGKRLILFLTLMFALVNLHAYEGLMSGQKKLKCFKTEFFDIIYPESSSESAAELALHADEIYREICADYGIETAIRMPVTITGSTDTFNAYYTSFTYNHIVLYDTPPQENMSVMEDTICDTFKHELTHALTINMKNPFWTFMAKVFGDVVTVGDYLNMTTFIKEGAAVAEESKGGFGRLNNPYYMHTVRQAKIQGSFPSQADVTGARDIHPGGTMSYAFGGPFTKWLQDEYGMEKYAEFWYAGINTHTVTYQLVFKKVYGKSINTAWKEFQESLYVPENILHAGEIESIQIVPGTSTNGFLYSHVTSGKDKVAWLDQKTSTVWITTADENGKLLKPKKFLTKANIDTISLSRDGRYLAVSYFSPNAAEPVSKVSVYDTQNKSHVQINEKSLRAPFVMQTEEGTFLCAVKTQGQNESLVRYRITTNGSGKSNKIKKAEQVSIWNFPRGEYIFSPLDFGRGRIACIYKKNGKAAVRIFDSDMNHLEIDLSETGLFLQGLSAQDDSTLLFSWARMDTLPRLGRLVLTDDSNAVLELGDSDISGGVYYPAAFNGKYFFTGNFVDRNGLFMQDSDAPAFTKSTIKVKSLQGQEADREQSLLNAQEILEGAQDWSTIFYGKGIFAPLSYIQEYKQNGKPDDIILLGLTWITSNPWDGNHFAFGGGTYPWKKIGGFMTLIRGGGNSSFFNYQILPTVLFNEDGFFQATLSSTFNTRISLNNFFYLLAQDTSLLFLGHQETNKNGTYENAYGNIVRSYDNRDDTFYLSFTNNFVIQLTTMRRMGTGQNNIGGVSVQLNWDIYSSNFIDETDGFVKGKITQSLYPVLSVALPNLIPIECSNRLTYNLPIKATAYFAPTRQIAFATNISSVLFSAEIQKGLTFFPLYFNNFTLRGEYTFYFEDENANTSIFTLADTLRESPLSYGDSISVTATLSGTINTGIFASSSMIQDYGIKFTYFPRDKSSKPFTLSFVTSLNF
ncbi:MAG: hypothetical protein IKI90_07520 [Treponema sp.]|nr:hypothetical protein [Treponema sp.]